MESFANDRPSIYHFRAIQIDSQLEVGFPLFHACFAVFLLQFPATAQGGPVSAPNSPDFIILRGSRWPTIRSFDS